MSNRGGSHAADRQVVFSIQGETDENGDFDFSFTLPDYIVASDLDQGVGRFYYG